MSCTPVDGPVLWAACSLSTMLCVQATSAWLTVFFVPLNSALNPYLYTFSVKPFRRPIDDLLRNWVEIDFEEEEEDEFDSQTGKEQTDIATSEAPSTSYDTGASSSAKTDSDILSGSKVSEIEKYWGKAYTALYWHFALS